MAIVLSVTVSPLTATIAGGAQQQFSALVTGTLNSQSVTWSTTAGTIDASGMFTAPAATGISQVVVVTAVSVDDITKSGAGTVTVPSIGGAVGLAHIRYMMSRRGVR